MIAHVFHLHFMSQDFRTHVDQSCRYSEEFINIYYDCMDKKRRVSCDSLFSDLERAGVDTKSDSVIET